MNDTRFALYELIVANLVYFRVLLTLLASSTVAVSELRPWLRRATADYS